MYNPWTKKPSACPEKDETSGALAFGEDILHYIEVGVPEPRKEYLDMLPKRVTAEFAAAVHAVMDLCDRTAGICSLRVEWLEDSAGN